MDVSNESMVATLNKLLRTCYNAQHDYQSASERLSGSILSRTLSDYATNRNKFANDLIDEIIKFCGSPVSSADIFGSIKRGWHQLTNAITKKDEVAMLEDCKNSDEAAMDIYETVLADNLPPLTKAILMKHYESMRQSVNRLNVLKKTLEQN